MAELSLAEYRYLRDKLVELNYGPEINWSESVVAPNSAIDFFNEYAWVVINSGMKNQVAKQIWIRVKQALAEGNPASTVFGHLGKAAAIQQAWVGQGGLYQEFLEVSAQPDQPEPTLDWLEELPWIGAITKFHLAKNLGVDCAKPDRWLQRVAAESGETVTDLCSRLASLSGDRIATVDLVIWRACNLGLWLPAE